MANKNDLHSLQANSDVDCLQVVGYMECGRDGRILHFFFVPQFTNRKVCFWRNVFVCR